MEGFVALAAVVGVITLAAVLVAWSLVRVARERKFHAKCLLEVRANDTSAGNSVDSAEEVRDGE